MRKNPGPTLVSTPSGGHSGFPPMVRERPEGHAGAMDTTPTRPEDTASTGSSTGTATNSSDNEGPRVSASEMRDLRRLRRSVDNRKVAGVAGGIARHLDIDPLVVRVTLVVLVFFGGAGLILYAACWLLVPEEGSTKEPFGLDERNRSIALVVAGVVAVLSLAGDSWGAYWFPWPLALLVLVVFLLVRRDRSSASTTRSGGSSRRAGPLLFWITLALAALGIGLLVIVDLSGTPVAAAAYPALTLATIAVMLLVGSVYGRAGGLILLGLVTSMALLITSAADGWDGTQQTLAPTSAVAVADRYSVGTGELVLDLTDVRDLDALDGRTIEITGKFGHVEVIVPDGLATRVEARVHNIGHIELFDREAEGFDIGLSRDGVDDQDVARLGSAGEGTPDLPTITIIATLNFGEIEVHS